jgi:pyruvate dehydrogenase E1 component
MEQKNIKRQAPAADLECLRALEQKVLWLASWTIHNANHLRDTGDGVKVGGHQASSASLATIMTALYFSVLRPEDRVAVKPHASPNLHAIQYLLGRQKIEKLQNFRGFKGAQSYPSRTKDTCDVDFSTGSVGLGVAHTLFSSLVQDYVHAHGWSEHPKGRMVALIGDAEMDEGNVFEAMLEGWKQGLKNCWWIIDYNRQSLDACTLEGVWERYAQVFRTLDWDVVILKYGSLLEAAFQKPGGDALRAWIDACPNALYSVLTFQGGAAWRKRLLADLGTNNAAASLIGEYDDAALARLMTNLAGHDLPTLLDAFAAITHERPVCFIAYTIKGFGLPLAGHKDNHAGLMNLPQMEEFRARMRIREGREWDQFEGLDLPAERLSAFLAQTPMAGGGDRQHKSPAIPVPAEVELTIPETMSTQAGFGTIMNNIGKLETPFAERIVTTSPDVTVSTNLGGWVNRRGLFSKDSRGDVFKDQKVPSTFNWSSSSAGQHMELGIAESNLFILLSALGLAHTISGARLLPVGTLYDPFIARGLDALNYGCYQDSRFILVATPSGISLAPEGGAHQSIGTPLIGMSQPGLSSLEPAFVDELAVMMLWAFEHIQKHNSDAPPADNLLDDEKGGSVYLRLSTRPLEQPKRQMTDALRKDIIDGAYWMREPGPNCQVVVAYSGAIAPEAINAVGLMAEDRRDIGLLAVTSIDRLYAGWTASHKAREHGLGGVSHIERLFAGLPPQCGIVTVIDGHPASLGWLGAVGGHRVRALGVDQFGQTGTLADLYRHYGIDTQAIIAAAQYLTRGRPIRYLGA